MGKSANEEVEINDSFDGKDLLLEVKDVEVENVKLELCEKIAVYDQAKREELQRVRSTKTTEHKVKTDGCQTVKKRELIHVSPSAAINEMEKIKTTPGSWEVMENMEELDSIIRENKEMYFNLINSQSEPCVRSYRNIELARG